MFILAYKYLYTEILKNGVHFYSYELMSGVQKITFQTGRDRNIL